MSEQTLTVKVLADISDLKKGMANVQSQMKDTAKSTSGITSGLKGIAGAAIAAFSVTAIIGFGKQMLETTADIQAMESQFNQVFKGTDNAAILEKMNEQSKEQNINVDLLKSGYSKLGSLLKSTGMDATKANEATATSATIAADSAAWMNISYADATSSMNSYLKGNYEASDAMGFTSSATQIAAFANDKYGVSFQDLTEDEKMLMRINYAETMQENSGATGQAARESQSFENILGNLKATWNRLISVVGTPVLAAVIPVLSKITEGFTWLTAQMQVMDWSSITSGNTTLSGMQLIVQQLVAFFQANLPAIQATAQTVFTALQNAYTTLVVPAFNAMVGYVGMLVNLFQAYFPLIKAAVEVAFSAIGDIWNSILQPVFLFIIDAVTGITDLFNANMPAIQKVFTSMAAILKMVYESFIKPTFDKIGVVVKTVLGKFSELGAAISKFVTENVVPFVVAFVAMIQELYTENKATFDKIQQVIGIVFTAIQNIITTAVDVIKNYILPFLTVIFNAIKSNMDNIKAVFSGVISVIGGILDIFIGLFTGDWGKMWDGVKQVFSGIWDTIKGIFNTVLGVISSIFKGFGVDFGAIWNNIKTSVVGFVTGIKDGITDKFNATKDKVTEIFNAIKSAITNPIDTAKGLIETAINAIKGFFNFSWSFPPLKMPHFAVSGSFSLNPLSVPKLGVDWYSRGGIFTKPTILNGIGVGDASNGGGSAAEVVAPLSDLKAMLGLSDNQSTQTINLNGNYSFRDKDDMDYFMNRMALVARRA